MKDNLIETNQRVMFKKSTSLAETSRSVVVHAHIFKNAGTTIDWILEKNFGNNFLDDRNDQKMSTDPDYLASLIDSKPQLKAISSHSIPLPLKQNDAVRYHTLVMLRDPLLRVKSVYDFERKQRADTPGAKMAKEKSFKDYVIWRMTPEAAPTIRNMHVRYLTKNSQPAKEELTEDHFASACEYVDNNKLLGLVEEFDKSMLLFSNYLMETGIEIDFAYQKQNVSSSVKRSKSEQIDFLESELGSELLSVLKTKNEFDIKLYNYAYDVLKKRFSALGNVTHKLAILT